MPSTFADLGVDAETDGSLRARGITAPFPIQTLTIPAGLAGNDICGRAPTGSGKTIAFGIPVAARAPRAKPGRPAGLVLAPTRELAAQIVSELQLLVGHKRRQRVAAFYGGVGYGQQLTALRRGVDIAVACPGRLEDLVARGDCDLSDVSVVVIDEADRMADMGFLPAVRRLLDRVRPDRQTLLFSATLDGEISALVERYQRSPVSVSVDREDDEPPARQEWVAVERAERIGRVADYVRSEGSTVVFCRTKHGTDRLAKQLVAAGVKAVPIHGGRTQSQRDRALASFSEGRVQALIATDVAARGIHVDGVACVVHFDLPATDKDWLHRSGRTGRAGASGLVVSLVTAEDKSAAADLRRALGDPSAPSAPTAPWKRGTARPTSKPSAPRGQDRRDRRDVPSSRAFAAGGSATSHGAPTPNRRRRRPRTEV